MLSYVQIELLILFNFKRNSPFEAAKWIGAHLLISSALTLAPFVSNKLTIFSWPRQNEIGNQNMKTHLRIKMTWLTWRFFNFRKTIPFSAAKWSGVYLSVSPALILSPFLKNKSTTFPWPKRNKTRIRNSFSHNKRLDWYEEHLLDVLNQTFTKCER